MVTREYRLRFYFQEAEIRSQTALEFLTTSSFQSAPSENPCSSRASNRTPTLRRRDCQPSNRLMFVGLRQRDPQTLLALASDCRRNTPLAGELKRPFAARSKPSWRTQLQRQAPPLPQPQTRTWPIIPFAGGLSRGSPLPELDAVVVSQSIYIDQALVKIS